MPEIIHRELRTELGIRAEAQGAGLFVEVGRYMLWDPMLWRAAFWKSLYPAVLSDV